MEQSLSKAIIFGLLSSVAGAILWAIITNLTGFQIGYMAIAIGALVGITIRMAGKGIEPFFGYIGAGLALFGCVFGNLLSVSGILADQYDTTTLDILFSLDMDMVIELMGATFSGMDLIFYGLAIYEGYKFSFRVITEQDIAAFQSTKS